jgi:hypothetical protein
MLLRAEPIFVAKGLVVADHRDPADRIMIIKTGIVEICLAIDSKVFYNCVIEVPVVWMM